MLLSSRGLIAAASLDIPWRFAPGSDNRYDPVNNPDGVVSFGTAENLLIQDELYEYASSHDWLRKDAFAYGGSTNGGPVFPTAMTNHINRLFATVRPVKVDNLVTAASLTGIHEMLGFSIGNPGDGILTTRPVYGRFELDFGNTCQLNMVYVDDDGVDPFSPAIVPKMQATLDAFNAKGDGKIRSLLIVNPNNPTGICYTRATLIALMEFCQKNSIHLISDEVYALSFYKTDDAPTSSFTSVLSVDLDGIIDEKQVQVLYGMSKDFGAAGLRIGCLITRNSQLRKAMLANLRFHASAGPSLSLATAMLEDHAFVDKFVATSQERLASARQFALSKLGEVGVRHYGGGCAGFFIYIDLSPWLECLGSADDSDDDDADGNAEFRLAQRLLDNGVGLHPREEHFGRPGWFRLVFSQQRTTLTEGLDRLVRTLRTPEIAYQNFP